MGMSVAILTFRAEANAIVQRGFQAIEVGSHNVHVLISDKTNKMLANTSAHDPCFAVMHGEALFHQNGSDVRRKALYASLERFTTRKCEIVSVTCVFRPG